MRQTFPKKKSLLTVGRCRRDDEDNSALNLRPDILSNPSSHFPRIGAVARPSHEDTTMRPGEE
jgi:hypothetical protein